MNSKQTLSPEQINSELNTLEGWEINSENHLEKNFTFPDFVSALAWVNHVGGLAEEIGHHPNISFTWGKACVEIWSHDVNSLTARDFALAKKIQSA